MAEKVTTVVRISQILMKAGNLLFYLAREESQHLGGIRKPTKPMQIRIVRDVCPDTERKEVVCSRCRCPCL